MSVELKVPGNVKFFSYFCINAISQMNSSSCNPSSQGKMGSLVGILDNRQA
jgi:hypothetical protein